MTKDTDGSSFVARFSAPTHTVVIRAIGPQASPASSLIDRLSTAPSANAAPSEVQLVSASPSGSYPAR